MTQNAIMKRSIGDEPPRGLNSPLTRLITNAPSTRPMISGLTYCTAPALWSLTAPEMSLMKHAMQNPMFPGFPKIVRRTAAIPTMQPVTMSRILSFDRPFGFSSDDFIKISFARVNDTILFLKRQWTLRILHCCGIIVCMFICRAGSFHEENILG